MYPRPLLHLMMTVFGVGHCRQLAEVTIPSIRRHTTSTTVDKMIMRARHLRRRPTGKVDRTCLTGFSTECRNTLNRVDIPTLVTDHHRMLTRCSRRITLTTFRRQERSTNRRNFDTATAEIDSGNARLTSTADTRKTDTTVMRNNNHNNSSTPPPQQPTTTTTTITPHQDKCQTVMIKDNNNNNSRVSLIIR